VAAETEVGLRGVYVHWDGYPSARLPALEAVIKRDGVGKAVMTILGEPHGWSQLDPNYNDPQPEGINGAERFVTVPGYGVQYKPYPIQGDETHWTPETEPGSYGDEYIYIINDRGEIRWADCGAGATSFETLTWNVGVPSGA
jgi:hypothetical protein